jgi:alkanesulfonate monooxygenase SsuD/methylene tetrahydromethanopterin reductase-like flavin-dependent oxidoreductase (luciferase family)
MTDRAFRFGVVAGQARTGAEWVATARRVEELGYDILLIPDTRFTLAPFPALAAAAAVTTTLHIGTYVLSAPNRSPALVAWEAATLQTLSDGRFELGIGGGRPGGESDAVAVADGYGTPAERVRRVAATIEAVREVPVPPRILVAASRPRMLELAAAEADIVTLGLPPSTMPAELFRTAAELRSRAGDRPIELLSSIAAVAPTVDAVPYWVSRQVGGDARAMAAAGGAAFLIGDPDTIAAELLRRREEAGFSYVAVNAMFMDAFEPVLNRLRPPSASAPDSRPHALRRP